MRFPAWRAEWHSHVQKENSSITALHKSCHFTAVGTNRPTRCKDLGFACRILQKTCFDSTGVAGIVGANRSLTCKRCFGFMVSVILPSWLFWNPSGKNVEVAHFRYVYSRTTTTTTTTTTSTTTTLLRWLLLLLLQMGITRLFDH